MTFFRTGASLTVALLCLATHLVGAEEIVSILSCGAAPDLEAIQNSDELHQLGITLDITSVSTPDAIAKAQAYVQAGSNDFDVLWGCPLPALTTDLIDNLFQPVNSDTVGILPSSFRHPDNLWFAPSTDIGLICLNRDRLSEETGSTEEPDLSAILTGDISINAAMPNPIISDLGYMYIALIDELFGREQLRELLHGDRDMRISYFDDPLEICKNVNEGSASIGLTSFLAEHPKQGEQDTVLPRGVTWTKPYVSGLLKTSTKADASNDVFALGLQPNFVKESGRIPWSSIEDGGVRFGDRWAALKDKERNSLLGEESELLQLAAATVPAVCGSPVCMQCLHERCRKYCGGCQR